MHLGKRLKVSCVFYHYTSLLLQTEPPAPQPEAPPPSPPSPPPPPPSQPAVSLGGSGDRIRASPFAKNLASQRGVSLQVREHCQ